MIERTYGGVLRAPGVSYLNESGVPPFVAERAAREIEPNSKRRARVQAKLSGTAGERREHPTGGALAHGQ
jgi:hypothetical protein